MADVFISYARRSSAGPARVLRETLAREGVTVFLDEREIPFGAAFPGELTRGLLDAKVTVVFADEDYFERPWCVHELRLLTAAYRAGDRSALPAVVIALPASGDMTTVVAHLPPPWAAASWPTSAQSDALADAVRAALSTSGNTLGELLSGHNDDAVESMRAGADQPLAWADVPTPPTQPVAPLWSIGDAPSPRGEGFIGRHTDLWRLAHECISARAFTPARTVVVRGLGGSGKSLLASEFVARYGMRFFPAGIVWVDCEQGRGGLLSRYVGLWRDVAPGEPVPAHDDTNTGGALAAMARALGDRIRTGTAAGRLLWVIDNLPEPGGSAAGLDAWCPALHHVTVLATTRRADTLRDAQATLTIGPLPQGDAVALLSRPPADARWMTPEEWKAVAHWAGELPLVLSLLRESLIDGGLSLETLRNAPKAEPAAASEQLMDALRGDVDDRSLRGAAEAFEMSWRALAADAGLVEAASQLALLAPVPLGEALLRAMVTDAQVGKLVRRGWLQPASGRNAQRAFTLHRVPASVLRLKLTEPAAVFARAFEGLSKVIEARTDDPNRLGLHLHVLMSHLFRMQVVAGPALVSAARRVTQAAAGLAAREQRGLRYLAARAAHAFGDDEHFAVTLASVTDDTEAAQAAIPHVLQPLENSPTARQWLSRLLTDPRDAVRWQALTHAGAVVSEDLALPLLQAILRETRADHTSSFDRYLRPPFLRECLSHLADAITGGDSTVRRRAAAMMGRALMMHGRDLVAGGFNGPWLIKSLVHIALSDEDAGVRQEAASAAGHVFDESAWATLREVVETGNDERRVRALAAAGQYLAAATAPRAPKAATTEFDDEGGMRLTVALGEAADPLPPEVIHTLIAWVAQAEEPIASGAASTLASLRQGLAESAPWVHARLDHHDLASVARFADALVHAKPDFVNAWWWRAQGREGLGDDEAACADYETVVRMAPTFTDASARLGEASLRVGQAYCERRDFDRAAPALARASELLPDRFNAHHLAALALYNVGRHEDAETAATRAIDLAPDVGEAWLFRAIARYASGHTLEALDDIRRAAALSPGDERVIAFKDQLDHWLASRDERP